jgi:hypothetical protein
MAKWQSGGRSTLKYVTYGAAAATYSQSVKGCRWVVADFGEVCCRPHAVFRTTWVACFLHDELNESIEGLIKLDHSQLDLAPSTGIAQPHVPQSALSYRDSRAFISAVILRW